MWIDTPKTLSEIKNKNNILNLNQINILELARIWTIKQLQLISESTEVNWINNKKVLNNDTIEIAKFIVEKIDTVLNMNINTIKDIKIENLVKKIWDKLTKSEDIEDFLIWTYIQKISNQISKINLRYERKLNFINAMTDNLTWLWNRRLIERKLDENIEKAERAFNEFSILLLDIDFFKNINDTFWHDVWDLALKWIAEIVKEETRKTDTIARWWWEEFLVILDSINHDLAFKKAEDIRKKIENSLIYYIKNDVNHNLFCTHKKWCIKESQCKNQDMMCFSQKITCSIWVATLRQVNWKIESKSHLVKRADSALYMAKHNWRNTVCDSETKKKTMNWPPKSRV